MSNANTIFAISDGTDSATSFDGTTWIKHELLNTMSWASIAGEPGKFLYTVNNNRQLFTKSVYSITDNINWIVSTLPTVQDPTILAIADNESVLYASTDGQNFANYQQPVFTYYKICTAESISIATTKKTMIKVSLIVSTVVSSIVNLFKPQVFTRYVTAQAITPSIASVTNKENKV
jgi:hypothetical protein